MDTALLWNGAVLGFSIAAPVGPIGMLTITRTLQEGRRAGLLTGMGAASADAIYGGVAALGLTGAARLVTGAQAWMRIAGGLLLLWFGLRLLLGRPDQGVAAPVLSAGRTFGSAFLLTAANPMTILSFAAMLASFGATGSGPAALFLIAGVFSGSMTWWIVLSCGVAAAGARIGPSRLAILNRVSGALLAGFGLRALFG